MEDDRLLGNSNDHDLDHVQAEFGESGETVVPKRSNSQLAIILLVLLCEPITAFMPMPFFAQVKSLLSGGETDAYLTISLRKLVTESGVTNGDPSQVGFYVGIIVR